MGDSVSCAHWSGWAHWALGVCAGQRGKRKEREGIKLPPPEHVKGRAVFGAFTWVCPGQDHLMPCDPVRGEEEGASNSHV